MTVSSPLSRRASALSRLASWFDGGRDVVQMINHFRDDMPHPIIGVGHSLGAAQLCVPNSPNSK